MSHRILIVDSEPSQREMLEHALKARLGYETYAVPTLRDAVDRLHRQAGPRPDIMLIDWPVPESANGDGHEMLMRTLARQVLMVAMVKYGDNKSAMAAVNAGVQDYFTKPVATERINVTFRNLLLLRDARREMEQVRRLGNQAGNGRSSIFFSEDGHIRCLAEIESEAIRHAMQYYNGRMTEVARRLGIGRSTLYRKLNMNIAENGSLAAGA